MATEPGSTTTRPDTPELPTWPGFEHIEDIFIFGDSYSAVGYDARQPHPTRSAPLGVELPGITYTESGDTLNWVGYLVKSFTKDGHDPLIFDYAVGGDMVAGVRRQITRQFLPSAGQKPEWAAWTSELSLFVTWVGINDIGWGTEPEEAHAELFELQERLYQNGARNFLFVDVPPVHRFPACTAALQASPSLGDKYIAWNTSLNAAVERFRETHSDISAFLFSSFAVFSDVLDNPEAFGLKASDAFKSYSTVWVDHLHPTSAVHKIFATRISEYLYQLEPKRAS
ncbi:hypothetical protein EXIGLDRAFT_766583 [Exidia glandulosa HHB12029]|uniref:Carbohydrate esterase family 16 protein n=1 Tax=Exidia glandulosa HHB12029 TaxID=1314781 RepID=A0A165JKR1_EXIGL|nr:hypothetical protein EXIGLDRAFT_766583 [Exidia glandulosa HHB12029]